MGDQRRGGDLAIYVPAPGHLMVATIAAGSGIVGPPEGEPVLGLIVIDYEGNLYRYDNVRTWADRVGIAEGRHRAQYPTVARMAVAPEALIRVGTLHDESDRLTPRLWVTDRPALAEYLGLDVEADAFTEQLLRSR